MKKRQLKEEVRELPKKWEEIEVLSFGVKGISPLSFLAWICPNCGTKHDRDVNASKNILKEGLNLLQSGQGLSVELVDTCNTSCIEREAQRL